MRSRRHLRVLFLAGVIALLAALLHCVRGGGDGEATKAAPAAAANAGAGDEMTLAADKPETTEPDTTQPDTAQPDAAQPDATRTDATRTDATRTDATRTDATRTDATAAPQPAPAKNPVATMLRSTNDADRTLLSTVERQTQEAPPPALLQLLSLRDAGKSRAELDRFINERLGADLRIQLAAKRWLRTSFGDAPAPESPLPGHGGGPRRMQAPVAQ